MKPPAVLVVGAGVIGASVAFYLARCGARVTCVDGSDRPASGTTAIGFATVTTYCRFPQSYFALNHAGIAEHVRLAEALDEATWWHPCGTLAWTEDESFPGYLDQLAEWGCVLCRHDASSAARVFGDSLVFPICSVIAEFPAEGWIDAVPFTERLLDEAARTSALVRFGAALTSVETEDSRVIAGVLSTGERVEADVIVNAAGSAADEVAALVGARSFLGASRSSLIAHLLVEGDPLPCILRTPEISIRGDGPGRVLMRSDQVDRRLPERSETPDRELLKDLLDRAQRAVPMLRAATVRTVKVVDARCPRDELPSAGALAAVPGYYEAVASAGITLGPLFGRLLADEIVSGTQSALLAPFSPNRFR